MRLRHYLKHWLIPHKQNDHRPHLIRRRGLVFLVLVIIGIQAAAYSLRPVSVRVADGGRVLAYASDITPVELLNQTNQQRAAAGLPALRLDSRLNQSAGLKSQNMFAENYWAHVSPSGIQPWYWFGQAGYKYRYAGENLARDFDTTSGTVAGWMDSPGHRANMLNTHYTDVGFAVVNGTLLGGETTLVVAHYGALVSATVAAAPAPATAKPAATQPVATPASTPEPTPLPATPVPTPTPAAAPAATPVAAVGEVIHATPAPKRYTLFAPLSLTRTLDPGTLVTLVLLAVLLVVYLVTHLTVWRKGLKRWRAMHYRRLAALQVGGLTMLILYLATTGFGQVG